MRKSITVAIFLVVVLLGYLVYNRLMDWHTKEIQEVKKNEEETWAEKTDSLEEMVTKLQDELRRQEGSVPEERLLETFGEKLTIPTPEGKEVKCEDFRRQIEAFFSYLDEREYVRSYNLKGGTHELLRKSVQKLSRNRPVISGETREIYNLIKNMAHFYRVLGKMRVRFIKDVFVNESDILEPTLALFYGWLSHEDCGDHNMDILLSNKIIYEYAGFFLNTLAGRSYVLRRESRVQALVGYYSILFIHQANERSQNAHGINIRPYINKLLDNLSNQRGLAHRKYYLNKMKELRDSYMIG